MALVALGMSGPASAAVTAVSYSASGELNDPNFNITPFDIQNSSTNTTNNFSGRVSLVLNNKLFRLAGRPLMRLQTRMRRSDRSV